MALVDLYNAAFDASSPLRTRMIAATLQSAYNITTEPADAPNHVERVAWAKAVFAEPMAKGMQVFFATISHHVILAACASMSPLTDDQIQTAVDETVLGMVG